MVLLAPVGGPGCWEFEERRYEQAPLETRCIAARESASNLRQPVLERHGSQQHEISGCSREVGCAWGAAKHAI